MPSGNVRMVTHYYGDSCAGGHYKDKEQEKMNSLHETIQKILFDEAVSSVRLDHDPKAEIVAL